MGVTPIRPGDDDDPAGAGAPEPAAEPGDQPEPDPGPTAEEEEAAAAAAAAEAEEENQQTLDFGDKLTLGMKGRKPTRSQVKIKSVSRDITGQIDDDDQTYAFVVIGKLSDLSFPISRDSSGRVTGKTRRHEIDPDDVLKIPAAVYDEVMDLVESASAGEDRQAA